VAIDRRHFFAVGASTLLAGVARAERLASLAERWRQHFLFGFGGLVDQRIRTAIARSDPVMTGILQRHAAILGVNAFYAGLIRTADHGWRWSIPDTMTDWAVGTGLPLRAHVLWWPTFPTQDLDWLARGASGDPLDRDAALAVIRDHVTTVVARYRGRFRYWDVVNELVRPVGRATAGDPFRGYGLALGPWSMVSGLDQLETAFRAAHAADPEARLFYNDFREWEPGKVERILWTVDRLRERGVPVHGLGLQGHYTMAEPTIAQLDAALARYAATGLELHVTELDINVNPRNTPMVWTEDLERAQARRYRELFELFARHAGPLTAVMTWNVTDATSWLRRRPGASADNWPLLFDDEGRPKMAVADLLR
jgi:endo-1,4-beta-xylanase